MADSHPWKQDPRDTRIPVAPPDTCSPLRSVVAAQEFPHLGVVESNDVRRLNRSPVVVRTRLIFGLLHQTCFIGFSQAEGSLAEHSVHRRGAGHVQAALTVPEQPGVDAQHMLIGRVLKGIVRQLHGCVKKGVGFMFSHAAILGRVWAVRHSEFPRVVDAKNFASVCTGN